MGQKRKSRTWLIGACLIFVIFAVGLRVFALESDPYPRLCWSTGLLTDEGFYIHNARNLVLFGRERTDEFNNSLIMPTLHYVQVAVFRLFGVSSVSARSISVVLSLATLAVFFSAMQRAFNQKIAGVATLFLGLDHINLLYNRMALMDTPAAFLLVCAFHCFVCQGNFTSRTPGTPPESDPQKSTFPTLIWISFTGLFLGLAFVTRGLTACAIPVPFLLLGLKRNSRGAILSLFAGLAIVIATYVFLWYLPHRTELIQVNRHYLGFQLLPKTVQRLGINLYNGWLGDDRGFSPFLFRHSPVQFALVLVWWVGTVPKCADFLKSRTSLDVASTNSPRDFWSEGFLALWALLALAMLSFINYAPSRYYVIFYPAFSGLAALGLFRLSDFFVRLHASPLARTLFGALLSYHLALSLLHHENVWKVAGVAFSALFGACLFYFGLSERTLKISSGWLQELKSEKANLSRMVIGVLVLWGAVNGAYLGDWLTHLDYTQRNASRWLSTNFPKEAVMIGDVAPGLCLDNKFLCVPVIKGLCNDASPFSNQKGRPGALIILDGDIKETWWLEHHPDAVRTENRLVFLPNVVGKPVGIYRISN